MIPQRIHLTITQEQIDKASTQRDSSSYIARKCCPTAQALTLKGYQHINVGTNYISLQDTDTSQLFKSINFIPSMRLQQFIREFDQGVPVSPGRFICKREIRK